LDAAATKVVVFGFERFVDIVGLDVRRDGLRVEFNPGTSLRFLHNSDARVAILPFEHPARRGTGSRWTSSADDYAATVQSIRLATDKGTAVCFILSSETPHPYPLNAWAKAEFDSTKDAHLQQALPGYLLLRSVAEHTPKPIGFVMPLLTARREEFGPFLDHFGATAHELVPSPGRDTDILAWAGENQRAAIACVMRRSFCLWLPTRLPQDADEWQELALSIARCVLTYVSKRAGEEPEWAKGYVFHGEREVRARGAEAREVLEGLEPAEDHFRWLRRVMWARDDNLHVAVVDVLRDLGIEVEVDEQYLEDFWIRKSGERSVIGEVKAFNPNIRPTNVASIVSHRSQRGLEDGFPALFVVRPFASEPRIVNRRVEPNVCRRAKADNVVVMRTLDLANVHNLIAAGKTTVADFLQDIKSGGGWLRIDEQGMKKLVS
jgi:hypothetical protein